jgi:hypothetical protein
MSIGEFPPPRRKTAAAGRKARHLGLSARGGCAAGGRPPGGHSGTVTVKYSAGTSTLVVSMKPFPKT